MGLAPITERDVMRYYTRSPMGDDDLPFRLVPAGLVDKLVWSFQDLVDRR